MDFNKLKLKPHYRPILLAAALIFIIVYIKDVTSWISTFLGILTPFFIGGAIAFVLNIPLRGFENKVFKKWTGKSAEKLKRPVCIILSFMILAVVVAVVMTAIVPRLASAVADIGRNIPDAIDTVADWIGDLSKKYPALKKLAIDLDKVEFDWDKIITGLIGFMKNGGSTMISSTVSIAGSIFSGVVNTVIGIIFACYILGQKETLAMALKKVFKAYLSPKNNERAKRTCKMIYANFSNFITGQCTDALVWGSMIIVSMLIFKMPYAWLIGVLIGFASLIPIFGSFMGCIIGAFLIFSESAVKAAAFILLFIILQQIEGNLIYPKIVGSKVGLPSILVLMAVMIGGSLFGVVGMLVFIPLVSTVYTLIRENVDARLEEAENGGQTDEDRS